MFITFEGPDGSGKTTALNKLINYLKKEQIEHILTREPGAFVSKENKQIREIITNKNNHISAMTEAILFSADRRQHLEKLIWPNLKKNKLLICDRYFDSTFAYQGAGRQLGIQKMINLQENVTDKTYPDLTFYFNIPVEKSIERIKKRSHNNRIDCEDLDFFKRVHKGYQEIIKMNPKRFIIIDASQNKEQVFKQVLQQFKKFVLKKS